MVSFTKSNSKLLSETIQEFLDRLSRLEVRMSKIESQLDALLSSGQHRDGKKNSHTTSSQMKILKFLHENPQGSTINEIKFGTGLAKATVSIGLKNLVDIGTVERIPSLKRDSRYVYVLAEEIPSEIKRMMELLGVERAEG